LWFWGVDIEFEKTLPKQTIMDPNTTIKKGIHRQIRKEKKDRPPSYTALSGEVKPKPQMLYASAARKRGDGLLADTSTHNISSPLRARNPLPASRIPSFATRRNIDCSGNTLILDLSSKQLTTRNNISGFRGCS
jgi:hypothetical protein